MSGLARASVLLGAGTIVSRVTGLLRSIVLVSVFGVVGSRAGDAFGNAIGLPNNIYAIISAGVLTAVIVPQIVKVGAEPDGGAKFISKLFTLGTVVLLGATSIAMICAPLLVALYAKDFTPDQLALATAFAYWVLPQLLFYGLYALIGETLNARRIFGPFTWAPIANNIVSIAGLALILVLFGGNRTEVADWPPAQVALVGGLSTLGIAAQAAVLLLFWRRTGLRLRPDFRWRGVGLGNIGRMAGWTTAMVIVGQIAGIVQSRVMSSASGEAASILASQSIWLVFMLPYSVIVLSIGTPYFTQLSEHAAAGRSDEVRADIIASIRTISLFIVLAGVALSVAALPASRIFVNSSEDAVAVAPMLLAYLVGLLPLSVVFVVQRTFYAHNDTRTPFVFTAIQGAVAILTAMLAGLLAPLEYLAAAVALGQSLGIVVQVVLAGWLLHRKLGGIGTWSWMASIIRFAIAAVPAGVVGWLVFVFVLGGQDGWALSDKLWGAIGTGVIGLVSFAVYLAVLVLMRAPEVAPALGMLRRLLPRR